ncbi:hypothetical protein B296_00012877 [Ensete ventricosum]|uniref:Uncharacterized protein n=1 Tax=Ensete ventricosum TaxID=4639 RepID=A0A426Z8M0_ENSVE|nr:hypothetical protein B296_00012877 [Ensete ventricosum]
MKWARYRLRCSSSFCLIPRRDVAVDFSHALVGCIVGGTSSPGLLGVERSCDISGISSKFARRFAEGIRKLVGNTAGDCRKKTERLTARMSEAAVRLAGRELVRLEAASGWRATRVATDAAGGEEWLVTTIEKESKAEAYFESGYDSEGSSSKRGGSGVMRSEGEEQRWPRWQRRARPRRRLRRLQRQRKQGAGIAERGSYGCQGRWRHRRRTVVASTMGAGGRSQQSAVKYSRGGRCDKEGNSVAGKRWGSGAGDGGGLGCGKGDCGRGKKRQ